MEINNQYCCDKKRGRRERPLIQNSNSENAGFRYFPPLKISQSCDAVPMNSSIGSDSHALVREAMKAWRASSGAAGGPPWSAPMSRLFAGQIIPQTFSNIRIPYVPPTPIDITRLLA